MPVAVEFTERQSFIRHWWALLLLPIIITVVPAIIQYSGHWPQKATATWIGPVTAIIIAGLLLFLRLDTRLDATGVHYRMAPLHLKWQYHPWTEVSYAHVRTYAPLTEYGGWGIKGFAANRAYNVAGSDGLQMVLTNGKRLLLGTQHPEEIRHLLAQLKIPGAATT
jgi:hypothetical protein